MRVKKVASGEFYLFRMSGRHYHYQTTIHGNTFLIKGYESGKNGIVYNGRLDVGIITFPRELIGKKIRLKVEVME